MLSTMDKARIAYDAYAAETGGKSLETGNAIPEFSATIPEVQAAWVNVVKVLGNALGGDLNQPTSPPAAQPTVAEIEEVKPNGEV